MLVSTNITIYGSKTMKVPKLFFLMLVSSVLTIPLATAMDEEARAIEIGTEADKSQQASDDLRKALFQAHKDRTARRLKSEGNKESKKRKREAFETKTRIVSMQDIIERPPQPSITKKDVVDNEPKEEKVDNTLEYAIQMYFGNPLPAIRNMLGPKKTPKAPEQKDLRQEEEEEKDTESVPVKRRRIDQYPSIKIPQQQEAAQTKAVQFLAQIQRDPLLSSYANKLSIKMLNNREMIDFSQCRDALDNSLLHLMVMHHHGTTNHYKHLIEQALALGADTNAQNRFGHTPLWLATYQNKATLVWLILSPKATIAPNLNLVGYVPRYTKAYLWFGKLNIDKKIDTTQDPMSALDLVEKILAQYEKYINDPQKSWLTWKNRSNLEQLELEKESFLKIKTMLTRHGANTNSLRLSPLHQAVQANDVEKVQQFINAGHDPEQLDTQGRKPIDMAQKDSDIFKLLIKDKPIPKTDTAMTQ